MNKKILYVDMDNVLVDFPAAVATLEVDTLIEYEGRLDEVPGLFAKMPPMEQALESYTQLHDWFETYILSTAPWENPSAWRDKLEWVKKYLGQNARKRLILSHNKHLNQGHYLIDDRPNNGAKDFIGEWIQFGSEIFPDWGTVLDYLRDKI